MTTKQPLIASAENMIFRVDSLFLPESARGDFEAGVRRNIDFISGLPGYRGHMVFEKTGGPGVFNLMTITAWASREEHERAAAAVTQYYDSIGFDRRATLSKWGGKSEVAEFRTLQIS